MRQGMLMLSAILSFMRLCLPEVEVEIRGLLLNRRPSINAIFSKKVGTGAANPGVFGHVEQRPVFVTGFLSRNTQPTICGLNICCSLSGVCAILP